MAWRCVNDLFGYCSGEPAWEKPPIPLTSTTGRAPFEIDSVGFGTCKKNPQTCGRYRKLSQLIK